MKKVLTVVLTMLVAGSLAFAQHKNGTLPTHVSNVNSPRDASSGGHLKESASNKSDTKGSKSHKGGKKGHKGNTSQSGKRQH